MRTVAYPDGEVVTQGYDAAGRPATLSGATAGTVVSASAYTATGQVTLLALGGGALQTAFTYDPVMQRLTQLRTTSSFNTLQELSYTYDPVGNVASITDGQGPGGGQQVQEFGYDSLDRLVSAAATGGAGGTYEHEYEYDEIGNITAFAGRTYDYSPELPEGWQVTLGDWAMEQGVLSGHTLGAASLILAPVRMTDGRISTRLACQSWEGTENGAILFDYQDSANYKFLRMRKSQNKWSFGVAVAGVTTYLTTTDATIAADTFYDVAVDLDDGYATLSVNGEEALSYDYGAAFTYDEVGLRLQNAHTHFDRVAFEPEAGERVVEYFTHHPHAVRVVTPTVGAADHFAYDANGNMVLRVEVSGTATITAERR